ncbi:F-box/LRR-repeat protein 14-like [Musa acuminata AAA Group]|uniref:F-box/LRR-repeat protein 14 n=1 Tax=Musa acuminata AAA Group TaxID=214697 RepID=UPI0031D39E8B
MGFLMEDVPEELLVDIVNRLEQTADRNSVSLACKRLCAIDGEQRHFLKVGSGVHAATEALTSLCMRFPNIKKLEIDSSGRKSNPAKQLTNDGLLRLPSCCPSLTELTLSFCSSIDDSGLAFLASCPNLRSVELNFAPAITCAGILSLVVGCKNLSALHLNRCNKVSSDEWLEYLGKFGKLEDLSIKNCRGISEDDLIKLGPGWSNLKRLEVEVDACHRQSKVYERSSVDKWARHQSRYKNLRELRLVNCSVAPGRGLSCLLGGCEALERLRLDMCVGVKDTDMVALAGKSKNLRSISIGLHPQYMAPVLLSNPLRLTDESLRAIAAGCSKLEALELSFSDGEFPSLSSCFSQGGVLAMIQSCPIRVLALDAACFFDDGGMEALGRAPYLHTLKLAECQGVTDVGMQQLLRRFPRLTSLELRKCVGVTDLGLKPLIGSCKLESLTVQGCPRISEEGVRGAARTVSYEQDSPWIH